MPLLFNPACKMVATDCSKYAWDLDGNNNLCLSQDGTVFNLFPVQPGNDLYAVLAQKNGRYLSLGTDNKTISATLTSTDGALTIRAVPLDTNDDQPFVWSVPATGDFLKVNNPGGANQATGNAAASAGAGPNQSLANGTGADDADCHFLVQGATTQRTE